MTMTYVLEAAPSSSNGHRGRQVKFTPERMEQIKNLVERGRSRDEIAELIGCTVGSLAVTCSKAGISLRRPRPDAMLPGIRRANGHSDGASSMPIPRINQPADETATAQAKCTLLIRLAMGERIREVSVPFPSALIGELAVMAELRNMRLADFLLSTLSGYIHSLTMEAPPDGKDGSGK